MMSKTASLLSFSAFLALPLFGCQSNNSDQDEDGFTTRSDCDDDNPAIHPQASEVCDNVDNNCDGRVDESTAADAPTWYLDDDGDGYGNTSRSQEACVQPYGYTSNPNDCDDAEASQHPGAPETDCEDPRDYNCDGSVGYEDLDGDGLSACQDCDDSDAEERVGTLWYLDADGDTYGNERFSTLSCDSPDGYVDNDNDCDDLAPESYPGAPEECDDSDNDCDGEVDEEVTSTYYADVDGDGYGDELSTKQACAVSPGFVSNSDDCDDTVASISPTAVEYCDTWDNDCDGSVDENDAVDALDWYEDADGDGYGNPNSTLASCAQPSGYEGDDTDCDDTDDAIHPGADDLPDDGIDQDCNGSDALVALGSWFGDVSFLSESMMTLFCQSYDTIQGDMEVQGTSVVSLGSLACLVEVAGDLVIHDNSLLTNIAGLLNVESVGGDLQITDNPLLPTSQAEGLRDTIGTGNIGGSITISGNQ